MKTLRIVMIAAAMTLDSDPTFRSTRFPSTSSYETLSGRFNRSSGVNAVLVAVVIYVIASQTEVYHSRADDALPPP